jgi:hypothetical protein
MNRRRFAAIAFVLISVAAAYSKSREQQAQNPYPYTQTLESSSRNGTATFSPVSYDASPSRSDNYDTDDSGARNTRKAAAAPAAPDVASWTRQTGGDRSAAVALPPNWNLFQIAKGTAGVSVPNKEQMVLGFQTFVVPGSRNYAPYMGPEQALNWFLRGQGVQLLGIVDRAPAGQGNVSGQSEFMTIETQTQDGTRYKSLALVKTDRMQMNIWKFYLSYVSAPERQFDGEIQTMFAIWKSWKLDPGYVQGAMTDAQNRVDQTAAMMQDHIRHNQLVNANTNAGIDNALRGVSVMENTDTGVRGETQIGTEQQVLRDCERRAISCRQVPDDQLVQPQ